MCFTLIRMAWDPGIKQFLHVGIVQRLGMTQWYIWYPGIIGHYSGDHQSERALVQGLLQEKFFVGRTVMSPHWDIIIGKRLMMTRVARWML